MNVRLQQIAKRAYSSLETIQASYDIARAAIQNGIPGDFVECGVAAGANAAAMALALVYTYPPVGLPTFIADDRRVHLFDSFTGIPQAGAEDVEFLAAGHKPGLTAHSIEEVRRNMREWGLPEELFVYHEGLFEDTVPNWEMGYCDVCGKFEVLPEKEKRTAHCPKCGRMCPTGPGIPPVGPIAVLRLDGDLYESTKVCIEHLYPLVSKGGWVIVDDWDLSGARKAILEHVGHGFGPIYWSKQS